MAHRDTEALRVLATHELDAISGGIINGGMKYPKIPLPLQPGPIPTPKEQAALA